MTHVRNRNEIKVLIGLDQRIDHLISRSRVDVCIRLTEQQQQLPTKVLRQSPPRLRLIMRPNQAHPLLVPPNLVHPVVIAATIRHPNLIEIPLCQKRMECVLPARRGSINPDPSQIHRRNLLSNRFHPKNPIREPSIHDVLVANVVKRLAPITRPHPVDANHDEPKLRHLHPTRVGMEVLRNVATMRTRINVLDHRIALRRIKVGRQINMTPNVRLSVSPLCAKHARYLEARLCQFRSIGNFQINHFLPGLGAPNLMHRSHVRPRVRIQQERTIRRIRNPMIPIPAR